MTNEQFLDARQNRRMATEHRTLVRQDKLAEKAEKQVGELCRDGKPVYYCYPVGGKYFESLNYFAVVDYLIRNRYVVIH